MTIDDSLLAPSEKTMLEDLIAAAINDARGKADAAAGGEMQEMTERPAASAGVQAALLRPLVLLPFCAHDARSSKRGGAR